MRKKQLQSFIQAMSFDVEGGAFNRFSAFALTRVF